MMNEKQWTTVQKALEFYAKKTTLRESDRDDAVADAMLRIWEKVSEFDANKAKFTTWAIRFGKGYIQHYVRSCINDKLEFASDSGNDGEEEGDIQRIEILALENDTTEEVDETLAYQVSLVNVAIGDTLTEREAEIFTDYRNGIPAGDTAKRLNVSNARISQIRKTAMVKIKDYVA